MPKEFVNPNLHVILIHFPLALLVVGTLIELFSFLGWRRSAFREGGRWMLLVGILSLPPVMLSGLYALADVNRTSHTADDATWMQVRQQSPVKGEAWEFTTRHAWSNAIGSVVLLVTLVLWMGSSDEWRRKLHLIWLLLLLFGLGTLIFGAWYGGEMVYRHGVGVEPVRDRAGGTPSLADGSGSESPAAEEQTDVKRRITYYAPPLQTHVILAGAAISLGLAALGISLRAGARGDREGTFRTAQEQSDIASAINPSFARPAYPGDVPDPYEAPVEKPRPRPAAARFWLLGALLAAGASLTGMWTLAHFSDLWDVRELWDRIVDTETFGLRRLAHVITGGGIIVLLLLLAVIARVTAGRRFIVLLFTIILIVALVAQIWFGSLLMFDTQTGPLGSFNGSEAALENVVPATEPELPATAPTTAATAPAVPATAPAAP